MWQTIAVAIIVFLAAAYFLKTLYLSVASQGEDCGGCGSCGSDSKSNLVQLNLTKSQQNESSL